MKKHRKEAMSGAYQVGKECNDIKGIMSAIKISKVGV
jgi:hypothetical protein